MVQMSARIIFWAILTSTIHRDRNCFSKVAAWDPMWDWNNVRLNQCETETIKLSGLWLFFRSKNYQYDTQHHDCQTSAKLNRLEFRNITFYLNIHPVKYKWQSIWFSYLHQIISGKNVLWVNVDKETDLKKTIWNKRMQLRNFYQTQKNWVTLDVLFGIMVT